MVRSCPATTDSRQATNMAESSDRAKHALAYMKSGVKRTKAAEMAGMHHATLAKVLKSIDSQDVSSLRHVPIKDVTLGTAGRPFYLSDDQFSIFKVFVDSMSRCGLYLSLEIACETAHLLKLRSDPTAKPRRPPARNLRRRAGE